MKKFIALFLVFSLLVFSGLLQAQICFRGKPAPECRIFTVIEAGYLIDFEKFIDVEHITYEFGLMGNLNKHHALGATFFMFPGKEWARGFKVRYRYWLSSSFSLDIAPGLRLAGGYYDEEDPQFTGHIGLNYKDLIALISQVDVRRYTNQKNKLDFSLGVKFGSYAGLVATGASIAALGLALLVYLLHGETT